jgi:hypothetical protein
VDACEPSMALVRPSNHPWIRFLALWAGSIAGMYFARRLFR